LYLIQIKTLSFCSLNFETTVHYRRRTVNYLTDSEMFLTFMSLNSSSSSSESESRRASQWHHHPVRQQLLQLATWRHRRRQQCVRKDPRHRRTARRRPTKLAHRVRMWLTLRRRRTDRRSHLGPTSSRGRPSVAWAALPVEARCRALLNARLSSVRCKPVHLPVCHDHLHFTSLHFSSIYDFVIALSYCKSHHVRAMMSYISSAKQFRFYSASA